MNESESADPIVVTRPKQRQRPKSRRQPRYQVVLWNDEAHTYAYVIQMMQAVFGFPREKGYQIAKEVDTRDRAIVITTTLEHAELKRDQIHAFGKDDDVEDCLGAMFATVEKAP